MGVQTRLQPVPSIGLGSNSVSPLEMASAYATLAAGGVHRPAFAIRKVVLPDGSIDGQRVWRRGGERRVLTDAQAYEVTRILEDNVQSGTGVAASLGAQPAAGKTGTTDRHTDAWFCGYTPTLATAVWVGYPNLTREMASVHGIAVAGGTSPAEIWGVFMRAALDSTPIAHWALPAEPIEWESFEGEHEYHPPPPPEPAPDKKKKPGAGKNAGSESQEEAPAKEPAEDDSA
jgi:penicillin-binding protein 1A